MSNPTNNYNPLPLALPLEQPKGRCKDDLSIEKVEAMLKPVKQKSHYTWCCFPLIRTQVFKVDEPPYSSYSSVYHCGTTGGLQWVILRPDGNLDMVSALFLHAYYTPTSDNPSFSVTQCTDNKNYVGWTKIKSKIIEADLYAAQIPTNVTSLFNGAVPINVSPAEHGKGDFIIVQKVNGKFVWHVERVRVMTPGEFANRFNLQGWSNCILDSDKITLNCPKQKFYDEVKICKDIQDTFTKIGKEWGNPATVLKAPVADKWALLRLEAMYREKYGSIGNGLKSFYQQQAKLIAPVVDRLDSCACLSFLRRVNKIGFEAQVDTEYTSLVRKEDGTLGLRYGLKVQYKIRGMRTNLIICNTMCLSEKNVLFDTWTLGYKGKFVPIVRERGYLTTISGQIAEIANAHKPKDIEEYSKRASESLYYAIKHALPELIEPSAKLVETKFESMELG